MLILAYNEKNPTKMGKQHSHGLACIFST